MNAARKPGGGARSRPRELIGRYALYPAFSSGGMASVHFARLLGDVGFTRVVAIKRLHENFAKDADFAAMLLDEARLAAHIHHPNVVGTLDVIATEDELFLVMEYVCGESLHTLVREAEAAGGRVPAAHAVAVVVGALHGLHAAHEAKNASGQSLGIVHRDVSPQNILVGEDGVARIIDFGVAKAVERVHSTREGEDLRGKIGYMAPEQLSRELVDRRADIYAASVVLWEALTHKKYIEGGSPGARVKAVLERNAEAPSSLSADVPAALDAIVLRGLSRQPGDRFPTARDMAVALEDALRPSTQREVGAWVAQIAAETLRTRAATLAELESDVDAVDTPIDRGSDRISGLGAAPSPLVASSVTELLPPSALPVRIAAPRVAPAQEPTPMEPRPLWRRLVLPAVLLAVPRAIVFGFVALTSARQPVLPTASSMPIVLSPEAPPVAATTPEPAPSGHASSMPAAAVPSVSVATAAPIKTVPHPVRPAPRGTCNPPFTMDNGIKVPKLGCL